MSPKDVVLAWVDAFNRQDVDRLAALYTEDATNHQVVTEPILGKPAIIRMFTEAFNASQMTCIVENLFEDGAWSILEWRDPSGLRGCGFFQIRDERIAFQRGYWDRMTLQELRAASDRRNA